MVELIVKQVSLDVVQYYPSCLHVSTVCISGSSIVIDRVLEDLSIVKQLEHGVSLQLEEGFLCLLLYLSTQFGSGSKRVCNVSDERFTVAWKVVQSTTVGLDGLNDLCILAGKKKISEYG